MVRFTYENRKEGAETISSDYLYPFLYNMCIEILRQLFTDLVYRTLHEAFLWQSVSISFFPFYPKIPLLLSFSLSRFLLSLIRLHFFHFLLRLRRHTAKLKPLQERVFSASSFDIRFIDVLSTPILLPPDLVCIRLYSLRSTLALK